MMYEGLWRGREGGRTLNLKSSHNSKLPCFFSFSKIEISTLVNPTHVLICTGCGVPVLPVEALLPVGIHLELGDHNLAGVDPDLDGG